WADAGLMRRYHALESGALLDRTGKVLALFPNEKGAYSVFRAELPVRVTNMLVQKEDRFFYEHPGINPVSIVRAAARAISGHRVAGASSITQQLVKNLLG